MTQDDILDLQANVDAGPDAIESALREIWKDLLHLPDIRPEDDFFGIGGDSLLAIRLLECIGRRFGNELLEPDIIYTASRFQDLVAAIRKELTIAQ